jgi:hypothetical protein
MFDGGEIGWRVIGSDPALIIAEHHVHDPVQAVLDRPMPPYDGPEQMRQHDQRSNVKSGVLFNLAAGFAGAFDHRDGVQARPAVAFLQPFHIVNDGGDAGLNAPIVGIDRLRPADRRVGEVLRLLLDDEQFDIVAQRALIAFQAKDVVGLLLDDLLSDRALTPHRVDRDDGAFDHQHIEKLRDRDDLVGFFGDLDLAKYKALAPGESLPLRRGAIQGCGGVSSRFDIEGIESMATVKLSDEALLAFLQSHPGFRERLASIVGAVGNADGDLDEADAAEERLIEELRLLGREALQDWAEKRVEATEQDVRGLTGIHRQGKKNSAGIRNSAR